MDLQTVIAAQAGDEAAFARLVAANAGRLNRIAFSILRDRESAQDATQQSFIDIWRKLPRLRDPARFEAWSYRFVVHACYAEARAISEHRSPDHLLGLEDVAPDAFGLIDDRDQLERAFRRLSVEHRAVVVLHHYEGLPMHEVAEVLGIAEGTAHSRLGRAMVKLRLALVVDEPVSRMLSGEVSP